MHRQILPSIAALALVTACSSGTDSTDASAAASDDAKPTLTPGMWKVNIEILESKLEGTMPGLPANTAEGFAAMVGRKDSADKCVTAEDSGDFIAIINPTSDDTKCTTDSSNISNSKIDVAMTCQKPIVSGGPMATENRKIEGEVTADRMELVTNTVTELEGLKITTAARFTGNRIGDCPAE